MSDGVLVTQGSGTTIATDDRTEGHVQEVFNSGGTTIVSGHASVTVTSAQAVATRARRAYIVLLALPANTDNIDIGPSGVASGSDGFPLAPGDSITLYTTAAIHADAAAGTQTLAYIEVFDA